MTKMTRQLKFTLMLAALLLLPLCLQSCLDDDDDDNARKIMPTALVTLKTNPSDGTFFMQLNDSTTITPTNITTSPSGKKEVRALVNYDLVKDGGLKARVNWIDTITTKAMVPNLGLQNDTTYGNDPLEIVNSWETCVEDGYLTLRIRTRFAGQKRHILNLVPSADGGYDVVLHHNARGELNGPVADALIAFRLSDLPDTKGQVVKLTLHWRSYSGPKSTTFNYKTRK